MLNVTYCENILEPNKTKITRLKEALDKLSDIKIKSLTNKIRATQDKKQRNILKKSLPVIIFNGEFNKRSIRGLTKANGLITLDIDEKEPDNKKSWDEIAEEIKKDPHTLVLFRSPSNKIKAIFKCEEIIDAITFKQVFDKINQYLKEKYGILLDEATKDISRGSYICYDPHYFYNNQAKNFNFSEEELVSPAQVGENSSSVPLKRIICPFHDDHTPSMQIYEDGRGFCFSCNASATKEAIENPEEALSKPNKKGGLEFYISKTNSKNWILDPELEIQEIEHACGHVKYQNELIPYFGAYIKKPSVEQVKGSKDYATINKEYPVIITTKGIFSEEDGFFKLATEMNIKNRWSLKGIKETTIQGLKYTLKDVYQEIYREYKKHLYYEKEEWYILDTVWDIATYLQPLFDKFLFLKHEGVSGSAKSKGMKLSSNITFNGRKWTAPTPANFFRYRHFTKATIYIEEAERLFDSKGQNQDLLVEYLNASYERGNYVPRQNDKDLNKTEEFDPCGFLRIGAINPLSGATEKRSLTKYMVKAPKNAPQGQTEVGSIEDYQVIRDMLYNAALNAYDDVKKAYKEIKNTFGIHNREWTIIKPLLAVAYCIEPTICNTIASFVKEKFIQRDDEVNEDSWEHKLLIAFIKQSAINQDFISNEEILSAYQKEIQDTEKRTKIHNVVSLSKKIDFHQYKGHNSAKTKRGYNVSFEKVVLTAIRNQRITEIELKKLVSEVSEPSVKGLIMDKIKSIRAKNKELFSDTFTDAFFNKANPSVKSEQVTDTSDGQDAFSEVEILNFTVQDYVQNIIEDKQNVKNEFHKDDFLKSFSEIELKNLVSNGVVFEHKNEHYKVLE